VPEGSTLTLFVSSGTGQVPLEDFKGKSYDEALARLTALGFTQVVRSDVPNDTIPKDQVISQDPGPGMQVAPNARVTLTVSAGKSAITVPDVSAQLTATAIQQLKEKGFNSTNTTFEASSEFPKGRVIRTNPAAGASVDKNQTITIFESTGPAPTTTAQTTTTSPSTTTSTTSSSTTRTTKPGNTTTTAD
jgi:serine/threonine-protein kinase